MEAIQLIDVVLLGTRAKAPRSPKNANDFSTIGRERRKRETLECERRFFGNTEKTTFEDQGHSYDGTRVSATKRELATLLLDPRACSDPGVLGTDG